MGSSLELTFAIAKWVKFMYGSFKGKFYAPVFSVSIGFTYKVDVSVKTSTQEILL